MRSARARLTAADQRHVSELANRIGWSGISLTVWLLMQETDGLPVEDALGMVEAVWRARHPNRAAGDNWTYDGVLRADPGVYDQATGKQVRPPRHYREAVFPYEDNHPQPIILPPVPGVEGGEFTVLRYEDTPVNPPRQVIDLP